MSNPTPSIREKFSEDFKRQRTIIGSPGLGYETAYAEWAFLEGMRVASGIAQDYGHETFNEYEPIYIKRRILKAIKEFKDEHPK